MASRSAMPKPEEPDETRRSEGVHTCTRSGSRRLSEATTASEDTACGIVIVIVAAEAAEASAGLAEHLDGAGGFAGL